MIIEYKGKKYEIIEGNKEDNIYLKKIEKILDEQEKEYLQKVVDIIPKSCSNISFKKLGSKEGKKYLNVHFNNKQGVNRETISLPFFTDNRMYKGMIFYKEYSIEELGLHR